MTCGSPCLSSDCKFPTQHAVSHLALVPRLLSTRGIDSITITIVFSEDPAKEVAIVQPLALTSEFALLAFEGREVVPLAAAEHIVAMRMLGLDQATGASKLEAADRAVVGLPRILLRTWSRCRAWDTSQQPPVWSVHNLACLIEVRDLS